MFCIMSHVTSENIQHSKPHTCPSFRIFIPSNGSNLNMTDMAMQNFFHYREKTSDKKTQAKLQTHHPDDVYKPTICFI